MPFEISKSSFVTWYSKDAIVIPAHADMRKSPGLSEEIFKSAGSLRLSMACRKARGLSLGDAFITEGFKSRYKYIIHAVCLPEAGGAGISDEELYRCYTSVLTLAAQKDVQTISIPLLTDGTQERTKEAFQTACSAIRTFLKDSDMEIELFIDRHAEIFAPDQYEELDAFVRDHWKEPERPRVRYSRERRRKPQSLMEAQPLMSAEPCMDAEPCFEADQACFKADIDAPSEDDLAAIERRLKRERKRGSFSDHLIRLIDSRGLSNVEVYTRANISRQQFSRIISKEDYMPQKKTIFAFAVALKLSKQETDELLRKAGHAFSDTNKMDVIMSYFIEKQKYDIYEINDALLYFGQPLLGSGM